MTHTPITNRDISWLAFNERVLLEAAKPDVPVMERFNFLSIYSSNLDEFYRVRMPAIMALHQLNAAPEQNLLHAVNDTISNQLQLFGDILRTELLPQLQAQHIAFLYHQPLPNALREQVTTYFLTRVAAYIQVLALDEQPGFFPENNKIYLAVVTEQNHHEKIYIINIPAEECGRFYSETQAGTQYILCLDDIIREALPLILPDVEIKGSYSFKITRDAELDLEDDFKGDIAEQIEQQIARRDFGLATRLLYDAALPVTQRQYLTRAFHIENAMQVEGGRYHNLKDLRELPIKNEHAHYIKWPPAQYPIKAASVYEAACVHDILLNVPYQGYDTLIRFFSEAAFSQEVTEIYITVYRIAGDSLIANALCSAARNGKKVTVFVELQARFDEANNIRWAKKLKAAGVTIIYSIPGLKVHAKVALVKRRINGRTHYSGVFSTGNFNESTARFYTDHILITTHKALLRELELLFIFLGKRRKPLPGNNFDPQHLLVAQFNLQSAFLKLIDQEIDNARKGLPARIHIKLNNLEEEVMIAKLYEAAAAGVQVHLIVRSICRIKPGVPNLSENITVKRIVDRYLEHGRIFIFHNNGDAKVYLGSADWMNRNMYRRIEVCFPVYDAALREQLMRMMQLQWHDGISAVRIGGDGSNQPLENAGNGTRSQLAMYELFQLAHYAND